MSAYPTIVRRFSRILAAGLVVGCAASEGYDPGWGNDSVSDGKGDSLGDYAGSLDFGQAVAGELGGKSLDLYVISLTAGDEIAIAMQTESGDLSPHPSLFDASFNGISSDHYDVKSDRVTKEYTVFNTGRYFVTARAYYGRGAGAYSLEATCTGGPCSGAVPPGPVIDVLQAESCVSRARVCAFAALPAYNGAVGAVRALGIWDGCVEDLVDGGSPECAYACDFDEYAHKTCQEIIATLPFFADATDACLGELEGCMSKCDEWAETDLYISGTDPFYYAPTGMCWTWGFHGNCPSYAQAHSQCGGDMIPGGAQECQAFCHATLGASTDDLDGMCSSDSDCGGAQCELEDAAANSVCAGEVDAAGCVDSWVADRDLWLCEDYIYWKGP